MMSFIGCIGNLMRGTGLEELLVAALGDRSPQLLGMPSQVVIPCRIPSTRENSPHSANSEKETSQNCTL